MENPVVNCRVNCATGPMKEGTFLGFIEQYGSMVAVVRHPDCGLYLSTYHPSRIELIERKKK